MQFYEVDTDHSEPALDLSGVACESEFLPFASTLGDLSVNTFTVHTTFYCVLRLRKTCIIYKGVARNLIWVGINGSRRQNNHIKNVR